MENTTDNKTPQTGKMNLERLISLQVYIAAAIVLLITLFGGVSAVTRLFNAPIPWAIEVTSLFLLPVYALGLAYTQKLKGHVRVEILLMRLPFKPKIILQVIALLIFLVFVGLIFWAGCVVTGIEFENNTHSFLAKIPIYVIYALLPLGAIFLAVQIVLDIVADIKILIRGNE